MANKFDLSRSIALLREKMPNGNETIGSKPEYYKDANASLSWAAKVSIALRMQVPNKYRIQAASIIVGRTIESTKELTIAEATAIWNSRHNPNFRDYVRKAVKHG